MFGKLKHCIVKGFFKILPTLDLEVAEDDPATMFYKVDDYDYILYDRWNGVYKFVEGVDNPRRGWKGYK